MKHKRSLNASDFMLTYIAFNKMADFPPSNAYIINETISHIILPSPKNSLLISLNKPINSCFVSEFASSYEAKSTIGSRNC